MAKSEKHLSKVQLMNSGQIEGNSWTFTLNGMKIFEKDTSSHQVILFVPSINETTSEVNYGIMTGQLDDDDILLKAQEVKLENAQIENGILKVTTNSLNDKIF